MTMLFTAGSHDIISKKIDARRTRRYGLEFTITFQIETASKYDAAFAAQGKWQKFMKEQFAAFSKCEYAWASMTTYDDIVFAQIKAFAKADKPSEIISEENLPLIFPLDKYVEKACSLLQAEHAEAAQRDQVHVDAQNATEIRDSFAKTARDRAAETMRFKQRLEGLVAEFKAESKIQLEKLIDETDIAELLDGGMSQRAIEIGLEAAQNHTQRSPVGPGWRSCPGVTRKEVAAHSVKSE